MAFQTRSRDPLFDQATQAALERRARELLGLALIAGGLVLSLALASYAPTDPSFLGTSTSAPQNWLGHFGAYVAAPLYVILGYGSWAMVLVMLVWGGRFVLHLGEDRAFGRSIFSPVWVAVAALYAATCPPGSAWVHSFGLGGLFGDTALGVLLGLLPMPASIGLILSAVVLGFALVALGVFALGFTRGELRSAWRFLWYGSLFGLDRLLTALGRGAARTRASMSDRAAARAERRAARRATEDEEPLVFDDDGDDAAQSSRAGLLARTVGRREPALASAAHAAHGTAEDDDLDYDDDEEDRVRAKITGAIRSRLRADRARVAAETRARREPVPSQSDEDNTEADPVRTGGLFGRAAAMLRSDPGAAAALPELDPETDGDLDIEEEEDEEFRSAPVSPDLIPRYAEAKPVVQHATPRRPQPSTRARAEAEPRLKFGDEDEPYDAPALSLLRDPATVERHYLSDEALEENARMLENVLDDYGVKGDIVSVRPGPVVTMYELEPAPGLKASRVIGLADDIARSMSALSARVSTVPGRSVIGIELPNDKREMVLLREILAARDFGDSKLKLPLALGKDIGGESLVANLAKMPHLLIAGTTGSGKSVAINTMILSLLYKLSPKECRLIMIDPKMLELSVYDDIPHLLSPVVTDPKKAVVALKWVVAEMEDRYRKMSKMGVRNIEGYNGKVTATLEKGEMFTRTVQTGFDDDTGDPIFETEEFEPETLPYIVVIVDEMADLMMVAG
ncbi:MAG: DNA translocase FtsK, partial [Rhodobacteraceae bacterium]|nr:DNA translocase FtsK [Paracoccaceae bacterium]